MHVTRLLLTVTALAACAEDAPPPSAQRLDAPIVYGADDRLDLYQVTDPVLRRVADSTAIIVGRTLVTPSGSGYAVNAFAYGTYGEYFDLCPSERFWDQPTPGDCSAFLVGPDLVATAGHCINNNTCKAKAFVFAYAMHADATTYPIQVPASDVYFCDGIVGRSNTQLLDYAIVRLDRAVTGGTMGRAPLRIRRAADGLPEDDARVAGMVSLSYPSGIPLKIKGGPAPIPNRQVGGVTIMDSYPNYFEVGADVAAGSSGSVIVSFDQGGALLFAEGNLVRGNPDFVLSGGCYVTAVCDASLGCQGSLGAGWEEYNRSTTWDHLVPAFSDCELDPDGCAFVVSDLGDACWDSGDTREGGVVAFDCGPTAAPRGSLHLQTRDGVAADKATLDRRAWAGGAGCGVSPVGDALADVQALAYTWHVRHDGAFTFAAPAVKILVDTAEANNTSPTSVARLEHVGDKILVYEPYLQIGAMMVEDVWVDESITRTSGRWWLVDLTPGGSPHLGIVARSDLRTLDQWTSALAAISPVVASVQLGVGSSNAGLDSWVDALAYTSTAAAFDVEMSGAGCAPTGDADAGALLDATGDFLARGVAKTTSDAFVRIAPADVVGASAADKDATLAELAAQIEAALADVASRPPGARAKRLAIRIAELRRLADGVSGGTRGRDLLMGQGAASFQRMLDRAAAALP